MNRRSFLRLGGGLIATATMAEAGALAEFMDWLRRAPAWSFPSREYKTKLMWDEVNAITLEHIRANETFFWLPLSKYKFKLVHGIYTGGNIIQEPFTYEGVTPRTPPV